MPAIWIAIKAAWGVAWAWVLPYVGPLTAAAGPWMSWVPGIAVIKKSARVASYVAAMGLAAWLAVSVRGWWEGDKLTQRESVAQCDSAVRKASLDKREAALDDRQRLLDQRAELVAAAEDEIATLAKQMEGDRAKFSQGDGVGVLSGDDGWLRKWAGRK